jgi:hypothetical protein
VARSDGRAVARAVAVGEPVRLAVAEGGTLEIAGREAPLVPEGRVAAATGLAEGVPVPLRRVAVLTPVAPGFSL